MPSLRSRFLRWLLSSPVSGRLFWSKLVSIALRAESLGSREKRWRGLRCTVQTNFGSQVIWADGFVFLLFPHLTRRGWWAAFKKLKSNNVPDGVNNIVARSEIQGVKAA